MLKKRESTMLHHSPSLSKCMLRYLRDALGPEILVMDIFRDILQILHVRWDEHGA